MLGNELKNMGQIRNNGDESECEIQVHKIYFENLKSSIDSYDHLSGYVNEEFDILVYGFRFYFPDW